MIGQTISHYRILAKLGEGGMGVVYAAEDLTLGRRVALKFLSPALSADPEARRRFVHEAKAAAALNHPGICTVYEAGEAGGQPFMAMEYVEGESLKERIGRGPLPIPQALEIAAQVAEALHEAHGQGITHRDVKPANIMLTPRGQAKVMDFGLAQVAGATHLTRSGVTHGTVVYMSPEQMRGETADHRTDLWSLGVVLYEMVSGRRPFQGEHEAAVACGIQQSEPEPLTGLRTGVPLELEIVAGKCLAKDLGQRYQHADELAVDLRHLRTQLDATRTVPRPVMPVSRPSQTRWWPLVAGVTVVVAAGVLFLFRSGRQAPAPLQATHERSEIAVLPFQNLSAEGPDAYFAGGLHDELLTQLSKVAALKVISRTSVMGYEGTTKPARQIAAELGVGSLVEGTVQVVGGRLRVNVQLIDAASDTHLWAERYDRMLDDAFAIQSDVAQQIVAAVGTALTSSEQRGLTTAPTSSPEAYRLYLQGREYFSRAGFLRQDLEIAQQLYERALRLDPDFALAHAALSQVHGQMYWFRYDLSPDRKARQLQEAETALRLAPDLPQAHVAMGLAYYWGRRDFGRALDEFTIALKTLPNDAGLWMNIGAVHRRLGHWDEVFAAFAKAAQLDPRNADVFGELGGLSYQCAHRYAEAVRAYDQALSLAPDLHVVAVRRGDAYFLWQGQLDTLQAVLNRLPRDAELRGMGSVTAQLARLLLLERNADGLLQLIQGTRQALSGAQEYFLPNALYAAYAHRLRGEPGLTQAAFDSALVYLNSAVRRLPDDPRVHASRGLVLAGLGRRDEALDEARWLQKSYEYGNDAYSGMIVAEERARILAQVGEVDAALVEIERLLAGPSLLSVHPLLVDPRWDPIRNQPRFQALLAKYGVKGSGR